MDLDESMLLLLRRARVLAPGGTLDQASATDRAAAAAQTRHLASTLRPVLGDRRLPMLLVLTYLVVRLLFLWVMRP